MLKKLLFLTVSLASMLFAQGTYEPSEVEESSYESNSYVAQKNTSSSYNTQEESYQPQQVTYQTTGYESASNNNIDLGSEPGLYIGVHPVSLLILTAIGMPSIYLTIEKTLSKKSSAIIRPLFLITDQSVEDISLSMLGLGVTGGYRYYFRKQHKGLYIEGELQFAYSSFEVSDSYDYAKATSIAFGPYFMIGKKWTFGSMALSLDAGVGLNFISISGSSSDNEDFDSDIQEAAGSLFGYDANLIWSLGI